MVVTATALPEVMANVTDPPEVATSATALAATSGRHPELSICLDTTTEVVFDLSVCLNKTKKAVCNLSLLCYSSSRSIVVVFSATYSAMVVTISVCLAVVVSGSACCGGLLLRRGTHLLCHLFHFNLSSPLQHLPGHLFCFSLCSIWNPLLKWGALFIKPFYN